MIRRIACRLSLLALILLPAACGGESDGESRRFTREQTHGNTDAILPSPDTSNAGWMVSANGQSIAFGNKGAEPFLTLTCRLRDNPQRLAIVRHVPARPGQQALFPVIGNGAISRFKVDAALVDGKWRWQGAVDATDPQLSVFAGPRTIEATLPGGGTLLVGASRIPAEFVRWCRAGGAMKRAQQVEQAVEALDQ
ncbi:hypothetical protein [Croceibacterium mercuriale]|uniref:hypothetical protein n=1 Tax=Croceibacterium mercuriale TaxID=1572751 RepID=UPI0006893764|nr:hypothetical protein [Croceibacterium mercuriale]